jgi:Carbohydrate binding module (family 6)
MRRRALTGLAGVALLLIGYGVGRWQDTPAPAPAAAVPPTAPRPSVAASAPSVAPATSAPPKPTVYPTLQAESANALTGIQTQDTDDQGGGQNVGWIATGDSLRFDDVDFGPVAATKLLVRVASGTDDGGHMEVHLDGAGQPTVGVLTEGNTGGWQTWRTDEINLTSPVTGKHTVFFTFTGNKDGEFLNVNWLQFEH